MASQSPRRRFRIARRSGVFAIAVGAAIGSAAPALADADGYYCVGADYLAYQFSFTNGAVRHRLHLVPLKGGMAVPEPSTVDLPLFDVRGMKCSAKTVALRGLKSVYSVDVSDRAKPVLRPDLRRPDPRPVIVAPKNLGLWSGVGRRHGGKQVVTVPLPSPGDRVRAVLRLTVRSVSRKGVLVRRHRTDLVLTDSRTGKSRVRRLFEGTLEERIDDRAAPPALPYKRDVRSLRR